MAEITSLVQKMKANGWAQDMWNLCFSMINVEVGTPTLIIKLDTDLVRYSIG